MIRLNTNKKVNIICAVNIYYAVNTKVVVFCTMLECREHHIVHVHIIDYRCCVFCYRHQSCQELEALSVGIFSSIFISKMSEIVFSLLEYCNHR